MSIQDSDNFPDLFNIDQLIILDQYSNTTKTQNIGLQNPFFINDSFFRMQSLSTYQPQFLPSYLQNVFKVVTGTFSVSSNWQFQASNLQDPSIQNLDRFNTLLQNFYPTKFLDIYYPKYSTNQLFINYIDNNQAFVQNISLLPPQKYFDFLFYYGNPVDNFGFCFFTHCYHNSRYSIFDVDRYIDQLQYIYNSPDVKKIQFYDSLNHKFSSTSILLKKDNIIYIQCYNSVIPFYLDSSTFSNQTLLFLQTSDIRYDYSQWQTTIFKSSRLGTLQIYNHFYPSIYFIFSFNLKQIKNQESQSGTYSDYNFSSLNKVFQNYNLVQHFYNHYNARWLLKLFNIHYFYNSFYFSLQHFLNFQNISSDQFPSISFSPSKQILDKTYKKYYCYINYPNYSLFHLQFFSDFQMLALHSRSQLNVRYFHDPIPFFSPISIVVQKDILSDDDINDFTFGTISLDSAQSNYNDIPDEDDLLLNHPRILQAQSIDKNRYQYICFFRLILDLQLTVDQFLFIFNHQQNHNSFNAKIKNSSLQYSQYLQKLIQRNSVSQVQKFINYTSIFLQIAISSFYIFLISNNIIFTQTSFKHSISLTSFSNNIISASFTMKEIQLIQKIGSNQLSNLIFSELQSFGDSYSYFSKTVPILPSSQIYQFQYFKPPLFGQSQSLPNSSSHISIFNHINLLLIPTSIPFYSNINSFFQIPFQSQSRQNLPLLLHSFSNFKHSRIQKYSFPYTNPFFKFKSSQITFPKFPSKSFPSPFNNDSILTSDSPDRNSHLCYTIQNLFNILSPHKHILKKIFPNIKSSSPYSSKESHYLLVKFLSFRFSSIVQKFSIFYPSHPPASSYVNRVIEDNIHIFSTDFIQYNLNFLSSYSFIQDFDLSQLSYLELVYILLKSFFLYTRLIDFSPDDRPDISLLINIVNSYDKFPDHFRNTLILNQSLFEKSLIVLNCLIWYLTQQFSHNIIDYPSLISLYDIQREKNKSYKLQLRYNLTRSQQWLVNQGFRSIDDFVSDTVSNPYQPKEINFDSESKLRQDDPNEFDDYYQPSDQESDDDNLDQYNQNYDQ